MTPVAAYDEIADWYEQEFLARNNRPGEDPLGIGGALSGLLGAGTGVCLEIGCGTGVRAAQVHELGWIPVGVDLSAAMLRHAQSGPLVTILEPDPATAAESPGSGND